MIWASLCCLVAWADHFWVAAEEPGLGPWDGEGMAYTQAPEESGRNRVGLWLLIVVGFYCLVHLLGDNDATSSDKQPPARQKKAKVLAHDVYLGHLPYHSCHGCPVKCNLTSLGKMEEDLVTLLYKLHKLKMALAGGQLAGGQASKAAQRGLPHTDLVIYTIQDES